MPSAVVALRYIAAYSASNADETTEGMIVLMQSIAPLMALGSLILLRSVRKWIPPALERALVSERLEASEWRASCIPLVWYTMTVFGQVAAHCRRCMVSLSTAWVGCAWLDPILLTAVSIVRSTALA